MYKLKPVLLLILFLLSVVGLRAQVSINTDNSDASPSAMLDVKSTDKGMLIPRMTAAERDAIAAPANGLLVYVTTDSSFYFYEGNAWAKVGRAGWSLNGNAGTNPATNFIGTSDDTPLVFRVNNSQAFRLEYAEIDPLGLGSMVPAPNVVGGFSGNMLGSYQAGATISGGGTASAINAVTANFGTIGGGSLNTVSGLNGAVGGGFQNLAGNLNTTVAGGTTNKATGSTATIAGGHKNAASGFMAAIGGGKENTASGKYSTVSGGDLNTASVDHATISGGKDNTVSGAEATISGGQSNEASGAWATISGGWDNRVSGSGAAVSGGRGNEANGELATVSGGQGNFANGANSTVTGGQFNIAGGDFSLASGYRAKIDSVHVGTLLFSDHNQFDFHSAAANEFAARATGGFRFVTALDGSGNPAQTVSIDNTGTVTAAAFVGDGSGLTGISDDQTLLFSGTTLGIENGNSVNLSGINTDNQTLSFSGAMLSIENGNSVDLSSLGGDNLGNHTATSDIDLNDNWLFNGTDDTGLKIDNNGMIYTKTNSYIKLGLQIETNDSPGIRFHQTNTLGWAEQNWDLLTNETGFFVRDVTNSSTIPFTIKNGAQPNRIVVKGSNVGIGADNPSERLDVDGKIRMREGAANGFIPVSDGNGVMTWTDPATVGDNFGNHTAAQNLKLNGHYLSGDGDSEGLFISGDGNVGINTEAPTAILDVNGSVRLRDGSPGSGKVLTSDAIGNASWQTLPGIPVTYYSKNTSATSYPNDDNWQSVSNPITYPWKIGDVLKIEGMTSLRLTGGTGVDQFEMRVRLDYGLCGAVYTNTFQFTPGESAQDHDNVQVMPYMDIISLDDCSTGSLTFTLEVRNTGDDAWEAQDRVLVITKL